MPEKIKSVTVYTESDVYRPGDEIKGHWVLTSEKEFNAKGITSTFQGVAFVKWTETSFSKKFEDDEYISYEVYTKQTKQVHGTADTKEVIQPGVYKFPFSYRLPDRPLPSSYEGSKGAVRYYLTLLIRRPIPFPDVTRYKIITVLEKIDVNSEEFKSPLAYKKNCQIPKALGFGNAGTVELWGRIDRRAYCPGEKIDLSVVAKNNSRQKLGKIKAQLMQFVTFTGNAEENFSSNTLKVVQSSLELEEGKVFKWTNTLIEIDGIPPTINRPSCQSIQVHYSLQVIVPVPFFKGSDLKLVFPITIGTVPYGKSLTVSPATQSSPDIRVYDASQAITYTTCNKGWSYFSESSSSRNFPLMSYTPMCAYVVKYEFKAQSRPVESQARKSTPTQSTVGKTTSTKPSVVQNVTPPTTVVVPSAPPLQTHELTNGAQGNTVASATSQGVVNKIAEAPQEESDMPPSYEEAIGILDSDANENFDEEEESEVWYVVIRFPKTCMEDFCAFIKNNKKLLDVHNGRFIFKSLKTYNPKGNWPKLQSIIMLGFPSKKQASDWYSTISSQSMELKWIMNSDIILTGAKEQYHTGKNFLTVFEVSTIEEEAEALTRYRNLIDNILRPLRLVHGGQQFIDSPSFKVLRGTWRSSDKSKFGIMAWPDHEVVKKYKSSVAELQKTIDELKEKCLIIHNSALFEVRDMSVTEETSEDENLTET